MKKIISFIISAIVIFNLSIIAFCEEEYLFYAKDSVFKGEGKWEELAYGGYNNEKISGVNIVSNDSGMWSIDVKRGYYEVFMWKCVLDGGCSKANISFSCTTADKSFTTDFSRGISGWQSFGTYFIPDGRATLKLTGESGKLFASAVKLVEKSSATPSKTNETIALKIDDSRAFLNGKESAKLETTPLLINNTTMVPIRFLSENLGYEVSWNSQERIVTITNKDTVLKFFIDGEFYEKNSQKLKISSPAIIQNDKTILPLRIISEEFQKKVKWLESGIIIISDEEIADTAQIELLYKN